MEAPTDRRPGSERSSRAPFYDDGQVIEQNFAISSVRDVGFLDCQLQSISMSGPVVLSVVEEANATPYFSKQSKSEVYL